MDQDLSFNLQALKPMSLALLTPNWPFFLFRMFLVLFIFYPLIISFSLCTSSCGCFFVWLYNPCTVSYLMIQWWIIFMTLCVSPAVCSTKNLIIYLGFPQFFDSEFSCLVNSSFFTIEMSFRLYFDLKFQLYFVLVKKLLTLIITI